MNQQIKIMFLIRSLDIGGAERQLTELVCHLDKKYFDITIVTFYSGGQLNSNIESLAEVRLFSLGKSSRWNWAWPLIRLVTLVYRIRPHIIHGYMGIANELAILMGRLFKIKTIQGIRASNMDLKQYGALSQLSFRTGAFVSKYADLIIFNSHSGRNYHIQHGYSSKRTTVIPNGIDTERFSPDINARKQMRKKWGIRENHILIGLIARIDPMKGHDLFLKAAALLLQQNSNFRFVCVGDGPLALRQQLQDLSHELGVAPFINWRGACQSVEFVYNALDIAVLTSKFGEGFPNVIAEAMSCGTPCVATNVGDVAEIIGDTGIVIEGSDAANIAYGCLRFLQKNRYELSSLSRERITKNFSIMSLVEHTSKEFKLLVTQVATLKSDRC